MASKDWAPLPQRKNDAKKKKKEQETKVFKELKDIFGSKFDEEIIMSVAQSCNYNLDDAINAFIKMTEEPAVEYESTKPKYDPWEHEKLPWEQEGDDNSGINYLLSKDKDELQRQRERYEEFERLKQESSALSNANETDYNVSGAKRIGTTSLCGLKVQYRPRGLTSTDQSDDDDADVVVEDGSESSGESRGVTPVDKSRYTTADPSFQAPSYRLAALSGNQSFTSNNTSNYSDVNLQRQRPEKSPVCIPERITSDISNGYKILILMRGVPGSGKSYLARHIVEQTPGASYNGHVFSADDYFLRSGIYKFDSNRLTEAHQYCQRNAYQAMKDGRSPVIVDNTNTQAWEMQPYAAAAVQYGYLVETLESRTPWSSNAYQLEKRNTHNVPRLKIQAMLDRYEPNITGERLIRMNKLKYLPHNQPPQMRRWPALANINNNIVIASKPMVQLPSPMSSPKRLMRVPRIPVQPKINNNDNNNVPVDQTSGADSEKNETKSFDNESLSIIAREYAEMRLEDNVNSFTAGSSFKEENSQNVSKLGPIGWERIKPSAPTDVEETTPLITTATESPLGHETKDGATASEKQAKSPIPEKKEERVEVEAADATETDQTTCKDFIIIINGKKSFSSRSLHEDDLEPFLPKDGTPEDVGEADFVNDGKMNYDVRFRDQGVKKETPANIGGEEFKAERSETDDSPAQGSDKSNSNNNNNGSSTSSTSSFERISDVDITSYEMCGGDDDDEAIAKKTAEPEETQGKEGAEDANTFLNFLKNHFTKLQDDLSKTSSTATVDTQRDNANVEDNSSSSSDTDASDAAAAATATVTTVEQRNANLKVRDKDDDDDSESNFESSNSEENDRIGLNVEAQLLEASADLQLVEQLLDYAERRSLVGDENSERQVIVNAPQEKVMNGRMKNIQSWEAFQKNVSKESINKVLNEPTSRQKFLDNAEGNAQLINWSESPFPVDSDALETTSERDGSVVTFATVSTFTDPYDFNVAFLGGIDGYKVIQATNRSINDPNLLPMNNEREQRVPLKLSLDKGTMTNKTSIFSTDAMFELEEASEPEDRSAEIVKRFRHIDRDTVLEIYNDLCHRNYDYAVDYISQLHSRDISTDYRQQQQQKQQWRQNESQAQQPSSSEESSSSPNNAGTPVKQKPRLRRGKKVKTRSDDATASDKLALKLELEQMIQMSEESYPEHTLKVKRWKNRDFSEPKNIEDCLGEAAPVNFSDQRSIEECLAEAMSMSNRLDKPELARDDLEEEGSCSSEEELGAAAAAMAGGGDDIESEDDVDVELNVGYDCIQELEKMFGGGEFDIDGVLPVISLPKSMAQQLHTLWIESMNKQFWRMQEQLDLMIAKDAEYARSLSREPDNTWKKPEVPNLKEIMDMEMALATYTSYKRKNKKELPKDIARRVTQETLYQMYPDFDRKIVFDIYEAHGRDFEETIKILDENSSNKSSMTMADVLKKRKNLIDELHKEQYFNENNVPQKDEDGNDKEGDEDYDDIYDEEETVSYHKAMCTAHQSREEARRQLSLRNENYRKAQEACRTRNPDVAAYYSDVAKLHMKNMERANARAASAYLVAQLHANDPEERLDLHYLHVAEAVQALHIYVDTLLAQMAKNTRKRVLIVTGRGARSAGGQSRIKPAIAKELNKMDIKFTEVNPGMLKVVLKKK